MNLPIGTNLTDRRPLPANDQQSPVLSKVSTLDHGKAPESSGAGRKSPKKPVLIGFWIVALIASAAIAASYSTTSQQFFGIAGSSEKSISFQYPVEIVRIAIIEGTKVSQHDTLLEVRRYDLAASLSIVKEQITELSARKAEKIATTQAEIKSLEARKRSSQSEINIHITKLESQLKLNSLWTGGESRNANSRQPSAKNVLQAKLEGLMRQKKYITTSYQATIDNLRQQLGSHEQPADAKLAALEKRKIELQRQTESLTVKADFSGRVGNILFAEGEQVEKFSPILTLYRDSPSYIKAYIHESSINEISPGQDVWVRSISKDNAQQLVAGRVNSLSNRIVEYPARLKRNPLVSAWGREANIQLVGNNRFLLGEKVVVLLEKPKSWIAPFSNISLTDRLKAGKRSQHGSSQTHADTISNKAIKSFAVEKTLESSGIVWDRTTQAYWMVGDESDELFKLNAEGKVIQRLNVEGLKINDAESLSIDRNKLYLLASLSSSKSGKQKKSRQKLVELSRAGREWVFSRELNLFLALQNVRPFDANHTHASQFIDKALDSGTLDIESHQVIDGSIILGFKSPQDTGERSVLLKISDLDTLFSNRVATVQWYNSFPLVDVGSQKPMRLSDLLIYRQHLYVTGVSSQGAKISGLWRINIRDGQISQLESFSRIQAEGIAINTDNLQLMVIFDGGGKRTSKFILLPLAVA